MSNNIQVAIWVHFLIDCPKKAVDLAKEATELDKAEKWDEALQKYLAAIDYFMLAAKCKPTLCSTPIAHVPKTTRTRKHRKSSRAKCRSMLCALRR